MPAASYYLIFSVAAFRVAVPVSAVRRGTQAVAVQPLPDVADDVVGGIVVAGRPVPVLDLRARFGMPLRALRLEDPFVIVADGDLEVALWVDAVESVEPLAISGAGTPADSRVHCDDDGLLVVLDVARYFRPEMREALQRTLAALSA
ncbi:MAG: hypothetical protein KatS3mg042_0499 [Rhodothermaceae bacterium]|nr:MAG: hypothetical protein KatS3mg042_0499 [Rhodothermaceae bacterium]